MAQSTEIVANEAACSHGWIHTEKASLSIKSNRSNPSTRRPSDLNTSLSPAEALFQKGLDQYQKKEFKKALETFAATVQLQWTLIAAHIQLGNTCIELKDFPRAMKAYEAVIEIEPYEPSAYFNIALVHESQNQPDLSKQWLTRTLDIAPAYAPAYFSLARLLHSQRKTREAIALLIRSAHKRPRNPDALVRAGQLYFEHTCYHEAIRCYEKALRIDAWHSDAYFNLGLAQFRIGRIAPAALSLGHSLNRNPKNKAARTILKVVQAHLLPKPQKSTKPKQSAFSFNDTTSDVPISRFSNKLSGTQSATI